MPSQASARMLVRLRWSRPGAADGVDYIGQSSICGPDGEVLVMAGQGEELLFANTNPAHHAAIRRAETLLAGRRPELYAPLTK